MRRGNLLQWQLGSVLVVCSSWLMMTSSTRAFLLPLHDTRRGVLSLQQALSPREREIRRKISALKKEGRLKKQDLEDDEESSRDDERARSANDDLYSSKIQQRLGANKSKMLGYGGDSNVAEMTEKDSVDSSSNDIIDSSARVARVGALPTRQEPEVVMDTPEEDESSLSSKPTRRPLIDPSLFDVDDDDEESLSDEELVDLVADKLTAKRDTKVRQARDSLQQEASERLAKLEADRQRNLQQKGGSGRMQLTSGVGGSYAQNSTAKEDLYQPKTGSWGAFPRPKDISKAYGGGRRIGPGFSNEEGTLKKVEATRDRLRQYREKAGILVQSEQDNAEEIEQALKIAGYAMQRGVYTSAVSALEKVTKYCSSNSRVGGKVYLELAMAYEAVGKSDAAIQVYSTLTKSRIDEIKNDAKRLLYGIEAIQFMQQEVGSKSFSRQKAKNTFIDTTDFANIASNFDDVYNTAWIDTEGSFYKQLTKSVVRSTREARQILLRATGAGEVERLRIVQALRSVSRRFDDALEEELQEKKTQEQQSTDENSVFIDGVPIRSRRTDRIVPGASLVDLDKFVLTSADQMRQSLAGEWELQLLADKRGDGVSFYNTTTSWQVIDMEASSYKAEGKATGFINIRQSGQILFDDDRRVLRREDVRMDGGMFAGILRASTIGAAGAVSTPHQVLSVDSILLVTRRQESKKRDNEKEYFAVWRRLDSDKANEQKAEAAVINR